MKIKINYFMGGLVFLALFIIADIILSHLAMISGSFMNHFLLRETIKIGLAVIAIIFFIFSAFKDRKTVVRVISICILILLSYWLIDKIVFIHKTMAVALRNQSTTEPAKQGGYVNIAKNKPYFNTDYEFTLSSDPNQSNPYTDYPDLYSFQVIPITKSCGDIAKSCPPAKVIPGFRWYPASERPPLALTQKITFPNNPVSFCFAKGMPEYGAGSIYDNYYYITKTNDNRCFAMHFVIHKANCEMFGDKEQIDKCKQNESKKDQIPNEYIKTFKFVPTSR